MTDFRDAIPRDWFEIFDEQTMCATLYLPDEDDPDAEGLAEVPCVWVVCPTCKGRGRFVNPNIDRDGITSSEWAEWGDEDRESYCRGGYDVPCGACRGRRVVPVPDANAINASLLAQIERLIAGRAEDARERAHELKMGY